ncbi:hypothetical protein JXB41_02115 [Candidatus Woesearchaeota archaeon]|nr:hypothetical protein [Candidatus Woesearchaeota archaeon]
MKLNKFKNQMMKRSQGSEFLGIVFLVVVLVVILLFNKIGSAGQNVIQTEKSMSDFKNIFVISSATKFQYITEKGISINELMGDYVCYRKEETDYGPVIGKINLVDIIRLNLDNMLGKNNWKLELNKSACITSDYLGGYWYPFDEAQNHHKNETCSMFSDREYITFEFIFPLACRVEMSEGRIIIAT